MLKKIKLAIRLDDDYLDEDIKDTIDAAVADLKLSGINKIEEEDPLIIQAIKIYCKANFSTDDKEAERYRESYISIRDHLSLSNYYSGCVVNEAK